MVVGELFQGILQLVGLLGQALKRFDGLGEIVHDRVLNRASYNYILELLPANGSTGINTMLHEFVRHSVKIGKYVVKGSVNVLMDGGWMVQVCSRIVHRAKTVRRGEKRVKSEVCGDNFLSCSLSFAVAAKLKFESTQKTHESGGCLRKEPQARHLPTSSCM